ncbi:Ubiquitin-like-specific protease 1, partial [Aphis craccivora]
SLLSQDKRKEHFNCLLQITYLCYNISNYCNKTNLKFNLSEWQCVYANDALQQSNTYDCGLYVCLHAFCYITDSYFFNTSSNGGREWLFYNSKKYLELLNKKSAQDHTYFKENDTKPLNPDDIKNITKLAKNQIENLFYTIHSIPIQPLTIKLKSK